MRRCRAASQSAIAGSCRCRSSCVLDAKHSSQGTLPPLWAGTACKLACHSKCQLRGGGLVGRHSGSIKDAPRDNRSVARRGGHGSRYAHARGSAERCDQKPRFPWVSERQYRDGLRLPVGCCGCKISYQVHDCSILISCVLLTRF